LNLGPQQLLFRSFEAELRERESERCIGRVEDRTRRSGRLVDVVTHPDFLGALPGKEQSEHLDLVLVGLQDFTASIRAATRANAMRPLRLAALRTVTTSRCTDRIVRTTLISFRLRRFLLRNRHP
jgi:hypothetical protein